MLNPKGTLGPFTVKYAKYELIRYGFSLVRVLVLILIRTIFDQSIITVKCLLLICDIHQFSTEIAKSTAS